MGFMCYAILCNGSIYCPQDHGRPGEIRVHVGTELQESRCMSATNCIIIIVLCVEIGCLGEGGKGHE